jgi:hypothetical protein
MLLLLISRPQRIIGQKNFVFVYFLVFVCDLHWFEFTPGMHYYTDNNGPRYEPETILRAAGALKNELYVKAHELCHLPHSYKKCETCLNTL